jgi:hypothetical protein
VTPADHYRRARDLVDLVEHSTELYRGKPMPGDTAQENLRALQLADVHAGLGLLASIVADELPLMSSSVQHRIVIEVTDTDGVPADELADLVDAAIHHAAGMCEHSAQNTITQGIRGPEDEEHIRRQRAASKLLSARRRSDG